MVDRVDRVDRQCLFAVSCHFSPNANDLLIIVR